MGRGQPVIHGRLPSYDYSLLVRTDFSDDAAWTELCEVVQSPQHEGFRAMVEIIDDPAHSGLSPQQVVLLLPREPMRSFIFIADKRAVTGAENPLLVIDLIDQPLRSFRAAARSAWAVENNLRLGNSDFAEFADSVDPDGVFRS